MRGTVAASALLALATPWSMAGIASAEEAPRKNATFFGVRLSLEVLRVGHQHVGDSFTGQTVSGASAQLGASPQVALTFTF